MFAISAIVKNTFSNASYNLLHSSLCEPYTVEQTVMGVMCIFMKQTEDNPIECTKAEGTKRLTVFTVLLNSSFYTCLLFTDTSDLLIYCGNMSE